MKWIRDATKRFPLRPHYELHELDNDCEVIVCSFLKKKYGSTDFPISTDDLTVLLETEVDDLDLYADLSTYGDNVEGITIFCPNAKPRVKIERKLSESPSRENRLRTTLTHEFGHVHFHSHLFDKPATSMDLFSAEDDPTANGSPLQLCKRDSIINAPVVDWMEWQAGHVCGAILMPVTQTNNFLLSGWAKEINAGPILPTSSIAAEIVDGIKNKFQVSREAARIRLLRLKVLSNAGVTSHNFG